MNNLGYFYNKFSLCYIHTDIGLTTHWYVLVSATEPNPQEPEVNTLLFSVSHQTLSNFQDLLLSIRHFILRNLAC